MDSNLLGTHPQAYRGKVVGRCRRRGFSNLRGSSIPTVVLKATDFKPNIVHLLSCGTQTTSDSYRITVQECEGYVKMLMEFNNMGDLMRSAMTKALINPQVRCLH